MIFFGNVNGTGFVHLKYRHRSHLNESTGSYFALDGNPITDFGIRYHIAVETTTDTTS